jgi:hypothetical protein
MAARVGGEETRVNGWRRGWGSRLSGRGGAIRRRGATCGADWFGRWPDKAVHVEVLPGGAGAGDSLLRAMLGG